MSTETVLVTGNTYPVKEQIKGGCVMASLKISLRELNELTGWELEGYTDVMVHASGQVTALDLGTIVELGTLTPDQLREIEESEVV